MLTFLHSSNVNIAAIQETKLTNNTKPHKAPGWAAVRLDRQKCKGGSLLMLFKETILFVDNTAVHPPSADPHLEQQGTSITMPNRQQLHIHNTFIPPHRSLSAGHNESIAHLLCNIEMLLVVEDTNAHHSRWDTNTNEDERGEQLAGKIDAADHMNINENTATRQPTNLRYRSPDICMASNDIALLSHLELSTSQASYHLPVLITIKSELSTIDGPRRCHIYMKKADLARNARNLSSTNATIEQAHRIHGGLLWAYAANNRTTRPIRAPGSTT